MTTQIDERTGLEILDREECLRLLRQSKLGRIAVVIAGRPLIFPVNFVLDGTGIVLRSDPGSMVYGACHGPVAFECDGVDTMYHGGWSVLATGIAEEVHHESELAHLVHLPLGPWCPGPKAIWLRIRAETLTGRRIPPHGHERVATP